MFIHYRPQPPCTYTIIQYYHHALPHIDDHHLHVQPLPQHTTTTTYNHNHHIKIPPQPPPPHSASCNVCLFVCAHISKCTSAPMKITTSASCSTTSIGAGCSNQMQLAQGHHLNADLALVLYLHLVAASRSYTCAQDGLDTAQLALVVFFLPPTSENTPFAVMVVITCCNLRWWCFSLEH